MRSRSLITGSIMSLLFTGAATPVQADEYETPPVFKASEILAEVPETRVGKHFEVREEVLNDGYWDFYVIDTPFGVFYAHGWFDLRNTIQEINAIAYLRELSSTRVFAQAALEKGLEPVEFAMQIVQHPIQTVRNIPRGIIEMFRRYAEDARELLDFADKLAQGEGVIPAENPRMVEACDRDQEPYPGACDQEGYADDLERLARRYFDVDDVMREYHEALGTDPYSSNEVLQEAIRKMSWIGGIGEYGMRKFNPLHRVEAVGLVAEMYKLSWRQNPEELRQSIDQIMVENGIPEEKRTLFLNNPYLTPSKRSFIVLSLEALDGVAGREFILDWAADSRSESEALYSMATVALIVWFHGQHPAVRFVPNALMPMIETQTGEIYALHPIDHLSWTEEVATILEASAGAIDLPSERPPVLWLLNRASDRARSEIEALGFRLVENGYRQILASGVNLNLDQSYPDVE